MDHAPDREPDRRQWIRAQQMRALYRGSPPGVIAGGVAAITLAVFLEQAGRMAPHHSAAFCAMTVVVVSTHLVLCALFRRRDPPDAAWRPWMAVFVGLMVLAGGTWIPGALWMTSSHDTAQALAVLMVSGMLVLGALPVFSSYLPAYLAFAIPVIAPQVVLGLIHTYPFHDLLAALTLTFLVAAPALAVVVGRQFTEGLRLRFENLRLIKDLRRQSERADEANRAKSSFLAAASHDLRQPVHALGLFVGALQAKPLSAPARSLVDQIAGSVGALDTLFGALLDISKLDAGAVEAHPQTLPLQPLLERLRRDYAADAVAKGLSLRLVRSSAWVLSDPVLLERILRNLISNAVKYTDAGHILIGCRRRGDAVAIEVWDTGRGIALDQSERVFEEFYQVDNPGRDRAAGLGLGLAIVRRLAPLIGGGLEMRSQPRRGSVFRLTLPRSAPGETSPAEIDHGALGALPHSKVLVIDDEPAILDAMAAVLTSWGLRVMVAASGDEALALLGREAPPDLVICDDRLQGGERGPDALRRIIAAIGRDIPALLITGDTGHDRVALAQASGYPVLNKPTPHGRLRAAVGQLLRMSAARP